MVLSAKHIPIRRLVARLLGNNEFRGIFVKLLTGDAGGGAAVQNLHPALIGINVMGLSNRSVRCLMHALNKAFEVACLDCFGSHGINHRGVTQMYWLVVQMFMRIKLQGGLKLIDEYYNLMRCPSYRCVESRRRHQVSSCSRSILHTYPTRA
jgi:hypothetical protein